MSNKQLYLLCAVILFTVSNIFRPALLFGHALLFLALFVFTKTMNKPLFLAARAVLDAFWKQPGDRSAIATAFRAAAAQMIKTGDLTDTAEDIIRGAERHHQAGWLCTMAAELEGPNG